MGHAIDRENVVQAWPGLRHSGALHDPAGIPGRGRRQEDPRHPALRPEAAMAHAQGHAVRGREELAQDHADDARRGARVQAARRGRAGGAAGEPQHEDRAGSARAARLPRAALEEGLQFVWIRWFMDYPDPHNEYFDTFYGKKTEGKRQAWVNEAFDKELEAGRDTRDLEEAADQLRQGRGDHADATSATSRWPGSCAGPRPKPTVRGLEKNKRARPWSTATSTSTCSRTCTWSRRRSVVRLQGGAPGSPGRPSSGKKRRTISRPPMTPSEQLRPELYAAFENRAPHIRPRARPAL